MSALMKITPEGFVYRWTNRLNGRWYIGSHAGIPNDGYVGSGKAFRLAVKKHGIGSFERDLLYIGPDYKDEEEKILRIFNAALNPLSYNLKNQSVGGMDRATKWKLEKALVARKRMSMAHTGVPLSEEHRRKQGLGQKAAGNRPPIGAHKGHPHSETAKQLIGRNTSIAMLAKKLEISFQEAEVIWQKNKL
jgi:hypothetical protein